MKVNLLKVITKTKLNSVAFSPQANYYMEQKGGGGGGAQSS
jgi:hypothetical protein